MNNSYKELRRNTLTIAIANLGSKIIAFLLAPLYSYYMTTSQYGTMDLINSSIGLILPFVCVDIFEATFRYSNDERYDKRKVLSTSIVIGVPGAMACFLFSFIAYNLLGVFSLEYWIMICASVMLGAVDYILAQFLRGTNKMIKFAMAGVTSSVALLIANYIFLVRLNTGLLGWIISYFISKIVETVYLLIMSNCRDYFRLKYYDKKYAKEFLKFCLPLMPTATMWWIMNLSDRYMLAFFLGASATGIYAVANKIPGLLSVFENIFYQAWQTTAIENLKNKNRDVMYSKVFNNYFSLMVIGVLGVLVFGKPMIIFLFEKDFSEAWIYIPILIICVVIHALNGNLGSLYSVFKNTKGALYSTIIGALTNVVLNFLFIPIIGIMGAALSTVIGYIVTLIYRWYDTKRFVSIRLEGKNSIELLILLVIQFALYYVQGVFSYGVRCIILIIALIRYRGLLFSIVRRK